jgi:hypothetical protein
MLAFFPATEQQIANRKLPRKDSLKRLLPNPFFKISLPLQNELMLKAAEKCPNASANSEHSDNGFAISSK